MFIALYWGSMVVQIVQALAQVQEQQKKEILTKFLDVQAADWVAFQSLLTHSSCFSVSSSSISIDQIKHQDDE